MKYLTPRNPIILGTLCLAVGTVSAVQLPQNAEAQPASRLDVVGNWMSNLDDHYTIRSNGTYTFRTGDKVTGNVSHSGVWSVQNGGHTLRLHANHRVVLEGRRSRTLSANKTFWLELEMPNAHTITLDGARFYRPGTG